MTAPYDQDDIFTPGDPRDWPTGWQAHPSHPGWAPHPHVCPPPVAPLTVRGCAALTVLLLAGVCFWIAVGTEAVRLIDRWLP